MLLGHVKYIGLGKLSECDVLVFESLHKLSIKKAVLKVAVKIYGTAICIFNVQSYLTASPTLSELV